MSASETLCRLIAPLRCWQYHKGDAKPVPRWVASHLMGLEGKKPRFYGAHSDEWSLDEDDWVVELIAEDDEEQGGQYLVYGDKVFREKFTLETQS